MFKINKGTKLIVLSLPFWNIWLQALPMPSNGTIIIFNYNIFILS